MIQKTLAVENRFGLHARVASCIAREARQYTSEIYALKNDDRYDFKSAIRILVADIKHGDTVDIVFDGPDEQSAVTAIETLFTQKFHEN